MVIATWRILVVASSMLLSSSHGFQTAVNHDMRLPHCKHHHSSMIRFSVHHTHNSEDDSGEKSADDVSNSESQQPDDSAKCDVDGEMSDRFKYKVNALLGAYDPMQEEIDNERQPGNILNALLTFPTWYSFVVVGRTNGQDSSVYLEQVKSAVIAVSGKDHRREWRITPRGKNFTKITVTALVESAAQVQSIYKALENLEMTVMKF